MKNCLGFIMFLGMFFQLSAASNSADQSLPASVHFFRLPDFSGSAVKMTILANDQPIVRLRNGSHFKYEAAPGNYIFSLGFGSSRVSLNIEPGKDYYIKCYINQGFWSGIPILELVDEASGKSIIEGNRLAKQETESISIKPRNSRLGFILSGGIGFENYPWFIDEDGDDITLSTGGGFGIGVEYGHQFNKNFDLSLNCFFQSGGLSRAVKNASASFNRMGITMTPSLVIPIKGGEMFRFRLGAGPGLYSLGTMKVDASKIEGPVLKLKYNTVVGIHGLFLFESNLNERGSMNMGIRYNSIHHKINTSGSSHTTPDTKINNPDGSGIDFILGYSFHF